MSEQREDREHRRAGPHHGAEHMRYNRPMLRTLPVVVGVMCGALLSAAGAVHAAALWTDPPKKRSAVPIASVAPLVDRFEPAVLVVFTETPIEEAKLPPGHPPLGALPFPPGDSGQEVRGQGAGFLITADGYALTNHHVVEDASSIRVVVGQQRIEIPATLVGSDEKTDIALIKLDGTRTDWPVIPLGDSDVVKVGDFVVAIGSPFGLEQSVSVGIISGRGRRDIAPSGRAGLYDFLQTDASINPGNSGGPLINLYGEVIGMNSAVNAAGSGIGFAIPVNMVKRLIPQLKEKGRFERSWIGVAIQEVPKDLIQDFGLERQRGALVREVVDGGPAGLAGVQPGDVIVSFEGRKIEDSTELPLLAGEAGVGKRVKLVLLRDQKEQTLDVLLGGHPDNGKVAEKRGARAEGSGKSGKNGDGSIGLTVVTLDADDRDRLKLKADVTGTRVTKVRPGSPAFMAGLQPDDVIVAVNGKEARTAGDFANVTREVRAGAALKLTLRRGASTLFVPLKKP